MKQDDQVGEKVATFNVKIGCWFIVVGCGSLRDFCSDEFISKYLKMKSCVQPYMNTIRVIPMNLLDLISVPQYVSITVCQTPPPPF